MTFEQPTVEKSIDEAVLEELSLEKLEVLESLFPELTKEQINMLNRVALDMATNKEEDADKAKDAAYEDLTKVRKEIGL